jgi:hypothetical protein
MAKGSRKNQNGTEPLSNYQDLSKTGRQDIVDDENRVSIISAQLKDGICNYAFEIIEGVGQGATHTVKGPGIVKDSLQDVFAKFNVHLAVIDDAFKTAGEEVLDIDTLHGHQLTGFYHVTGFSIKGSSENERIVLQGNKYVSTAGGRMELKSPPIPLDNLSSYKWYNELKELTSNARSEVKAYNDGNYTPIEKEEEDTKMTQMSILDSAEESNSEELEAGRV